MIKTHISILLVVFLAAQMIQGQESLNSVFDQMDVANETSDQTVADEAPTKTENTMQDPVEADAGVLSWLFEKGVAQYKAGNFDEAIRMFDGMLAIDEYNADAIAYQRRTAERIASVEAKKYRSTRMQAIATIDAAWSSQAMNLGSTEEVSDSAMENTDQQAIEQVIARLKAITMPNLDFADASIGEVIRFIADASRGSDGAGTDVDFLLAGMESATGSSRMTISVSEMSLYDALQYVVDAGSLKFEIKPNLVVIMPANYIPDSAMVMKSYDIMPEVGSDLESSVDVGGGAEDLFGDSSSDKTSSEPVDVSSFFSIVDFPEGASAIYQPRFKKLFVKTTPKNLKAIEAVLTDLDEQAIKQRSEQVLIEAKFVEFNEGALEELGFDWSAYGSGTAAGMEFDRRGVAEGALPNATRIDPITGQAIYSGNDSRPGQNVFGSAQRDNTQSFESNAIGLLSRMGGTPATMLFNNDDIDLQISAMQQEGTADVLSAPKVIAKSGTEALIRIAETHRFPQDYDAETGQDSFPVVKPQDWEDFDVGVSLKVTPVVDMESATIDLDLYPQALTLRPPDLYPVGVSATYGGFDLINGIIPRGSGQTLFAVMPAFERRSVQSEVTVADGHTIVLGGMISERTETFRDQVPILGDIPYLGRLFRTEGSRSAKKNLTIFVKTTIVDTRGMTRVERKMAYQ